MKATHPAAPDAPRRGRAPAYRASQIDRDLTAALTRSDLPLSAYALADRLRAGGRRVTIVAIYRALARLCAEGNVERVEMTSRYRLRTVPHAILMTCSACGATLAVPGDAPYRSVERALVAAGFTATKIALEAGGVCAACEGRAEA